MYVYMFMFIPLYIVLTRILFALKLKTTGTINMLGLAKRVKARILLASTSEIYGDPEVHPQPEVSLCSYILYLMRCCDIDSLSSNICITLLP